MPDLQSLHIQLANLKVIFEEEVSKGSSMERIRSLFSQIKEVEKQITGQKAKPGGDTEPPKL